MDKKRVNEMTEGDMFLVAHPQIFQQQKLQLVLGVEATGIVVYDVKEKFSYFWAFYQYPDTYNVLPAYIAGMIARLA